MIEHFDVVYCEGWEASAAAVVGPLGPDVARQRDLAGEQYAVLLLVGGVPQTLIEVSWRHHVCLVWRFDGQLRRVAKHDLRRLAEDQLLLIEETRWSYPDGRRLEFDPTARRESRQYFTDGRVVETYRPSGDDGGVQQAMGLVPVEELPWCPAPSFGDWAGLASLGGGVSPTATCAESHDLPAALARSAATEPPWRPPAPLRPGPLAALFEPGTRLSQQGEEVTVEVHKVGRLRMPTGRLVVADPALLERQPPFIEELAPGSYPVALSVLRWPDDPDRALVAAARLAIDHEPVSRWELALCAGQDPRTLADGAFFGFGVDSGQACFADAAAAGEIAHLIQRGWHVPGNLWAEHSAHIDLPAVAANAIVFSSGMGDGAYPTWIGRTAGGRTACFVADLLVAPAAGPFG
jgi:hypothetical protein